MVATRMPANERKALMLEAAVRVFARVGYAAATTDSIAREASVSQAYVVRFFRSKETLFEEAARAIVVNQQGSTSMIQRRFSIGYNRAGRLMDQMEKAGIVGAAKGSKPREVLLSDEVSLDNLLASLRG